MQLPLFLLEATKNNSAEDYLPIGLQLLFVAGLVATMLGLSAIIGPRRKTKEKLETFASGLKSHSDARQPMVIKFFLVAILFVLFDVEVIFFYPYAVNFKSLGWDGFMAVVVFVAFFLAGFIYIIKKGALKWEE